MNTVKENLTFFLPAMVELIGDSDFPWGRIERHVNQQFEKRTQRIESKTSHIVHPDFSSHEEISIQVELTLYDLIIETIKQQSAAKGLFIFLNKLFEELCDTLQPKEKLLLRSNVRQLLMSFDLKFLDFVGEIAVLNQLIKSKNYRLKAIETRQHGTNPIDFTLQNINDKTTVNVEVVNIQLNSAKVDPNPDLIRKFLEVKLSKKVEAKTKAASTSSCFYLIPVLWGEASVLKVYQQFFRSHRLSLSQVMEPVAYISHIDKQNNYQPFFGRISQLDFETVS